MAPNSDPVTRLREFLQKVTTFGSAAEQLVRELKPIVELITSVTGLTARVVGSTAPLRVGRFVVDRATFSVSDGIHACELGNTVCFRFVQCLASEPNRYFTLDELRSSVWLGQYRAPTTIRSAVFEVRAMLREAGMSDLANAIRAEGHTYGLRVDLKVRTSQQKPNGKPTGNQHPRYSGRKSLGG